MDRINSKVIVTSSTVTFETSGGFTWGEGYKDPREFTLTTNILYQLSQNCPPFPLEFLHIGVTEVCNYKPNLKVGKIEYLKIEEINIELSKIVNEKIDNYFKNWIGYIFVEKNFENKEPIESAISKAQNLFATFEESCKINSRYSDKISIGQFKKFNLSYKTKTDFLSMIKKVHETYSSIRREDMGFCCILKYEKEVHTISYYRLKKINDCWCG